jgi:hypothetical protein
MRSWGSNCQDNGTGLRKTGQDFNLAVRWLTARGPPPLLGAAVRGWWDAGRVILAADPLPIQLKDCLASLSAAVEAGQEDVVSILETRTFQGHVLCMASGRYPI